MSKIEWGPLDYDRTEAARPDGRGLGLAIVGFLLIIAVVVCWIFLDLTLGRL